MPRSPDIRRAVAAIQRGDVATLEVCLCESPNVVHQRVDGARTLLHVATDWPGHFPNGADVVKVLVAHGADVNARYSGEHTETPLHWAASSDDVEVLDALLDAGADIEADGAVIGGGTPLADAVAFGQWNAARRLIERGARSNLWQAAAMGQTDRVKAASADLPEDQSFPDPITQAFWCACHGGRRETAEYLLEQGADINWVGYDDLTPLDAARRTGAADLVEWLEEQGGHSAST